MLLVVVLLLRHSAYALADWHTSVRRQGRAAVYFSGTCTSAPVCYIPVLDCYAITAVGSGQQAAAVSCLCCTSTCGERVDWVQYTIM